MNIRMLILIVFLFVNNYERILCQNIEHNSHFTDLVKQGIIGEVIKHNDYDFYNAEYFLEIVQSILMMESDKLKLDTLYIKGNIFVLKASIPNINRSRIIVPHFCFAIEVDSSIGVTTVNKIDAGNIVDFINEKKIVVSKSDLQSISKMLNTVLFDYNAIEAGFRVKRITFLNHNTINEFDYFYKRVDDLKERTSLKRMYQIIENPFVELGNQIIFNQYVKINYSEEDIEFFKVEYLLTECVFDFKKQLIFKLGVDFQTLCK